MQDQLDRSIELPKKRIPWIKYFFQISMPAFLVSLKATAQGEVRAMKANSICIPEPKTDLVGTVIEVTGFSNQEISGTIIDEDGKGIPYASVFIKGTSIGAAADSLGRFKLLYPGIEDNVVLISSSVGFQSKETIINIYRDTHITNVLLKNETVLSGEVLVTSVGANKESFILAGAVSVAHINFVDSFVTLINKIFLPAIRPAIYPNPVKSNTAITVDLRKQEEGNYIFQLYTMTGQMVMRREKSADKNIGLITLAIPSLAPGTYLLRIQYKRTGEKFVEKIIVEL